MQTQTLHTRITGGQSLRRTQAGWRQGRTDRYIGQSKQGRLKPNRRPRSEGIVHLTEHSVMHQTGRRVRQGLNQVQVSAVSCVPHSHGGVCDNNKAL